ncbi:MAG: acyl-CoA reductase [Chitinophagaceae bacterium]|nr:acyl-CoA reductase [Chitinophagaceae bacterium]
MNNWIIVLGEKLAQLSEEQLNEWTARVYANNPWFTPQNVKFALDSWIKMLEPASVNEWLSHYTISASVHPKTIGLVMAGNIPFAGFHDVLCVLAAGHKVKAKRSSQDRLLPEYILSLITSIDPEVGSRVTWVEKIENVDAVIATGSGNTSRYFHYYFAKWPHIIRKNRTSVAVLSGKETDDELRALGKDVFTYFGLGCRNVSKLFIPEGSSPEPVLRVFEEFTEMRAHNKFANNYDYNRSVYYLNHIPFFDNLVLILKEDEQLASPIGVLYYEFYKTINQLQLKLEAERENIQCIVSKEELIDGAVAFGEAQNPSIADYADGVDTMEFLLNL